MEDFFISYNKADKVWAEGLANWLDQAMFSTILQEQDFVAGSNFVSEMHNALKNTKRLIMVLSPDYLSAKFPEAEWTAAFASNPTMLIPVRVRECQPDGLLKPIVYIDLINLSAAQARDKFVSEVKAALNGKRKKPTENPMPSPQRNSTSVNQTITGDSNTQVAGDYHHYERPRKPKVIITPPEGAVSPAELKQIDSWIENLVENTLGKSKSAAFGMWRNRFKHRFSLTRSEQLLSAQMPDAEAWYRQQSAINKRGWKAKAPDAWRNARYAAIKIAMEQMRVDKIAYYAQIGSRLKMKKPFMSLTELTKIDLERVYTMALRDARGE
ncbi:MAG TPA: toll/interleukin-1 receptor domain-containing protein [Puia sp.]|jgi:hypothetical protein|nr:toll/interleukin-1 receptor domain-containing protein [Puia sp.]